MASDPIQPQPAQVFEQTYRDYLSQIQSLDLSALAFRLGARETDGGLEIPFFGESHHVTPKDIICRDGRRPDFSTRLILLKYILLCPTQVARAGEWIPYHGFKDSGPLTVFFPNTVESPLAAHFSRRLPALDRACRHLGGRIPQNPLPYDRCHQFTALPRISLLVTFNDEDSDFPAQSTIFFRESADRYLDCECLAILGGILSRRLIKMGS